MRVKKLNNYLQRYLAKKGLTRKFDKQVQFLINNPSHPSLNLELLEPKIAGQYSFRLDRKHRAIFIFTSPDEIEIIDINPHYQ
jgi:Txe/YoeB family toxin of Txe-Axe toxin-antitoxin module